MDTAVTSSPVSGFRYPETSLSHLDTRIATELANYAADVTLLIDQKGTIRDLAYSPKALDDEGLADWIGKPWIDTVTVESKPKIQSLLSDRASNQSRRWRQVNHPSPSGVDLPVGYLAMDAKSDGWAVAIGRDLRTAARLQQRLVSAQQAMERDYAKLREAESRYQLLFQMSGEGVLVLRADNLKITDANASAGDILGEPANRLSGRSFISLFDSESAKSLRGLLAVVRSIGAGDEIPVRLADGVRARLISASLFRQRSGALFLVRISAPPESKQQVDVSRAQQSVAKIAEAMPDGFVVADRDLNIVLANEAFLEMAQLASSQQAQNFSLGHFVGRPGIDLNVLVANLREHGSVRNFETILNTLHGYSEEVEISAVTVPEGDHPCYGFSIRSVGARRNAARDPDRELPHSVEQLTELVGRVSLKEIVRETTDLIERMCIEAALELTGDNRASAAEMLGLSRQSLYSKLHRHSLGDLQTD